MSENYLDGVRAAQIIYDSKQYDWISKPMLPRDAMKIFMSPVVEMKIEMQMPLPKDRQEWLKGFEEEQNNILRELNGNEQTSYE